MKYVTYTVLFITGAITLFILWHGPVYVYRVFVWQESDYDDYTRFRTTPVLKDEWLFEFQNATFSQKDNFISDFESLSPGSSLESFLTETNTYAFIVIRNDTLLFEKYLDGHSRESLQTSFSTTKSILSLLTGIAVKEGKITSVHDRITDYVPELLERDQAFSNITILDLLNMRSGLKFDRGVQFPFVTSDEPLTYSHPNLRKVALNETKIESHPDQTFKYNDYNALLLGLILERTTGEPVSQFLERTLWKQLGMAFDASWITDQNGFEQMQSGVNARAIDFAKIGRLVLNNGNINGKQVVDSTWIDYSTTPNDTLIFSNGQKWGYGCMWWNVLQENRPKDIFACGHMGQFIYISPSSRIIIVRHGLENDKLDDDGWTDIFSMYVDKVHPYRVISDD